jgi:AraC-like DNA-binding protein
LEILEENKSDSEFNSARLQEELGVSRTLLHVKLKALTGQSTTEFIRTYRLKYAASLLLQDFGNIAEVAYESGFNDQGYFAKSFRKHFGVAPSEYKESK